MTIRTRLWLWVTALLGFVLAGNAAVVFSIELRELNAGFEREAVTFATLAGPQALRAFGESGRREGDAELKAKLGVIARGLPSLKGMALHRGRGRVLVSYPRPLPPPEPELLGEPDRAVRIGSMLVDGEECLTLTMAVHGSPDSPSVLFQLFVSKKPVEERIRSLTLAYGGSLALLLVLGAFLAQAIARRILSPVESLKRAAFRLRDGDLSSRAEVSGGEEVRALARAFNDMAQRIERESEALEGRNAELERAYNELQALQEELSKLEKFAAVGRTAASVSHEIDNPIGVILGTANMLARELGDRGDLKEDVELIEAECLRVRRIVRDLLDFARPAPTGSAASSDLGEAVRLVLRGLKHHPELKDVKFGFAPGEGGLYVSADPDSIKQVVLNLLLNAARASSFVGEVEVRAEVSGGMVVLSVLDRGVGIKEENLERIFTPFFSTGSGAGLGLAVSRRLVEGAGGHLWAAPREGGGSMFCASWPKGE